MALLADPQDQNLGLVTRVVASIPKKRIANLKDVYTKMTVRDVAHALGMQQDDACVRTEAILQDMVSVEYQWASELTVDRFGQYLRVHYQGGGCCQFRRRLP
jgi:hypothetical protein